MKHLEMSIPDLLSDIARCSVETVPRAVHGLYL